MVLVLGLLGLGGDHQAGHGWAAGPCCVVEGRVQVAVFEVVVQIAGQGVLESLLSSVYSSEVQQILTLAVKLANIRPVLHHYLHTIARTLQESKRQWRHIHRILLIIHYISLVWQLI